MFLFFVFEQFYSIYRVVFFVFSSNFEADLFTII